MILWLFIISASLAETSLERPSPPIPAPGECSRSAPLNKGEPPPASVIKDGLAVCSAVIEPTTSLAYLLAVEKYSLAADEIHQIEVNRLHAEIDGLRTPLPWHQTPRAQRWIGRLEVFGAVALVAGGASVAYYYGTGGRK